MKIAMMGTGTFAEPTFEALLKAGERVVGLVTQPERDSGAKRGSTRQTGRGMAAIAAEAGVPTIQPQSINSPEGLEALKSFGADLLVVAAYGQILKPVVIEAAPLGAINVHASLLPKYRGASPIAHAILNGETTTGVTIIRITPGLDAGEMLAKVEVQIHPDETTGELEARLAPLGANLALEVIQRMKSGPVSGEKQDPTLVTKAPKLKKEQGLIDWSESAAKVACRVRAMQPWPTAYSFLHRPGQDPLRLLIQRTGRIAPTPNPFEIGSLHTLDGIELGVVCGGTEILEICDLQPAGKKRQTAAEFLRGYPIRPGAKLDGENPI